MFWMMLISALRSLRAHAFRSLLTMLGIVIGVAAVITVLAIGQGSRAKVLAQIESLGSNLLYIQPGPAGMQHGRKAGLSIVEAERVSSIPGVIRVSPELLGSVEAGFRERRIQATVLGGTSDFSRVRNFRVARGRFFTSREDKQLKKVCVLGSRVAERLLEGRWFEGQTISLDGISYQVLGVLETKGEMGWFQPDQLIIVPLSTARRRLLATDDIDNITVKCASAEVMPQVSDDIVRILRKAHRTDPARDKDQLNFHLLDQREHIRTFSKINRTFTALLGSLAGVALLVGGIGIMNIMLVSVTERTSEIGIRKAVGARQVDILMQFLIEALCLSLVGAGLGVGLGIFFAGLLSGYGQWQTVVQAQSVLLAVAFGLGVGLIFGLYPAFRAARLDPIQALRSE